MYEPELPLIDDIFRTLAESQNSRPPALPPVYRAALEELAQQIWQEAPWSYISEHEVITIDLSDIYTQTIYLCILGMAEQEYGLVFYRSLDSLKQFRESALQVHSNSDLEQIFLSQDCWFLNYETDEDWDLPEQEDLENLAPAVEEFIFGSIHPYEGLRRFLDDDEATVLYLSFQALLKFFRNTRGQLAKKTIPPSLTKTYMLASSPTEKNKVSVTISTQPAISEELLQILEDQPDEDQNLLNIPIDGVLVPENALVFLDILGQKLINDLIDNPKVYSPSFVEPCLEKVFPVVLIQTTRSKAKEILEIIKQEDGLKSICLHRVRIPELDFERELGLIKTNQGSIYIFQEFDPNDHTYKNIRQQWTSASQQNNGYCALILAMGASGSSSGKPLTKDMLGLTKVKFSEDVKEILR
jgi:hypothetical protein